MGSSSTSPSRWCTPRVTVYAMLRRLLLTSVPLVFTTVESMLLFILAVSIITTVFQREAQAEQNAYLGAFVYVCHWQVVLVIIGMLAVDAQLTEGVGTKLIGLTLLLSNLAVIGVVFVDTRSALLRLRAQTSFRKHEVERVRAQTAMQLARDYHRRPSDFSDVNPITAAGDKQPEAAAELELRVLGEDAEHGSGEGQVQI